MTTRRYTTLRPLIGDLVSVLYEGTREDGGRAVVRTEHNPRTDPTGSGQVRAHCKTVLYLLDLHGKRRLRP